MLAEVKAEAGAVGRLKLNVGRIECRMTHWFWRSLKMMPRDTLNDVLPISGIIPDALLTAGHSEICFMASGI